MIAIPSARARSGAALRAAALLGAAFLAACSDRTPTRAAGEPPEAAPAAVRIECSADVRAGAVRCGEASVPEGVRALIVGGQGTFVRLASTGTAYDAQAEVLSSSVTVQNLLAQALGTTLGDDVAGVRVFFAQPPVVTAGTGTVQVANPDGVDAFTAGGQPYFHYAEILAPQGTSLPKRWEFSVPATVETFTFTVLVQAPVHDEGAPLRWTRQVPGALYQNFAHAAWSGGGQTFAVGDQGLVLRHDGGAWSRIATPGAQFLRAVWGTSPRSVWAVGMSGAALRFDGNRWTNLDVATRNHLYALWGASDDSVFAVGARGTIVRWNGSGFWPMTSNTTATLSGIWGSSSTDVVAVGTRTDTIDGGFSAPDTIRQRGVVARFDGSAWTTSVISLTEEYRLEDVIGFAADSVYAAGSWRPTPQHPWTGVLLRWDGQGWTRAAQLGTRLYSLWTGPGGEVLAAGDNGVVLRYHAGGVETFPGEGFSIATVFRLPDGEMVAAGPGTLYRRAAGAWAPLVPPNGLTDFAGIWATPDGSGAFAVGANRVTRFDGAQWTTSQIGVEFSLLLTDVWGRSAADVYAVGRTSPHASVSHWDGTGWTTQVLESVPPGSPVGDEEQLNGVHGAPDGSTFAVGVRLKSFAIEAGTVRRLQGGEWPVVATVPGVMLMGVWAASESEVWAVGRDQNPATNLLTPYAVRIDGPSPTPIVLSQYGMAFDVWGASSDAVFAVGYHWSPARLRYVGVVWLFDGSQWNVVHEADSDQYLTNVWGTSADNVYAVGAGGTVLHYNGVSWASMDAGSASYLDGVHVLGRGDVFIAGWGGELLRGRR